MLNYSFVKPNNVCKEVLRPKTEHESCGTTGEWLDIVAGKCLLNSCVLKFVQVSYTVCVYTTVTKLVDVGDGASVVGDACVASSATAAEYIRAILIISAAWSRISNLNSRESVLAVPFQQFRRLQPASEPPVIQA